MSGSELVWMIEAEKVVDKTVKPLEREIQKARRELEKNPTFQFLEKAKERLEGRDKKKLNWAHFNPGYDYHKNAILKRRVQTLARTSKIELIHETKYEVQERHPEFHEYTLAKYISSDKNSQGVYGFQADAVCNCPQNKTTLILFRMKDKHQISEIKEELTLCEQKKNGFYIYSSKISKAIDILDRVEWDLYKGHHGERSHGHYLPLVAKRKEEIKRRYPYDK